MELNDDDDDAPTNEPCFDCGCHPCVCEDSNDFCLMCGNLFTSCECYMTEPLDDVDANTRGDIG